MQAFRNRRDSFFEPLTLEIPYNTLKNRYFNDNLTAAYMHISRQLSETGEASFYSYPSF